MNTDQPTSTDLLLAKLGFQVLAKSEGTKNGPDVWAMKNGRVYTIERKTAKIQKGANFQVRTVEKNRLKDDFIAIEFPSGYVLLEPMKDHLKACAAGGTRNLHALC